MIYREELKKVVKELYFWRRQLSTNFSAYLFDLFCKSDENNFFKLGEAFPDEALIFTFWRNSEDENVFFASWGF